MRPVSQRFLDAVTGSHRQVTRALALTTFQTGTNPTGTELPIHDGACTFDAGADVRGRLDITLTMEGEVTWPAKADMLMAPYGNEIFVTRGIEFGDGSTEVVSQGYFKIQSVSQTDDPKNPLTITAQDRMSSIVEARLEQPRQFVSGTSIESMITNLVGEVYPSFVLETDEPSLLTKLITRSQICEEDRYRFLYDLATSRGKILYFDYRGVLMLVDAPDATVPVLKIRGGSGGVLVRTAREVSRDGAYNAVVATGEAADEKNPVRGVARDMNPRSPTFWNGNFGKKPRFFSSPLLETDDQAVKAARTLLNRILGMPYVLNFAMVPNPALEPFDPVLVRVDNDELHVLDKVVVPLTVDAPVVATTRLQINAEELAL